MTSNERPEQREGSVPGQPGDLSGGLDGRPAERLDWLDAETAERLLEGEAGTPGDDPRVADLARLLAMAVKEADTSSRSADDERLVLQAFRDARGAEPTRAGFESRRARWWRASRPTKTLVGGVAAVCLLSGVAIAAQTGALPHPFHAGGGTTVPRNSASAVPPSSGTSTAAGTGRPAGPSNPATSGSSEGTSAHPSASGPSTLPLPSLKGLCVSYVRLSPRGEHLDSTAQRRLEAAAGGPGEVASYCARLTGAQPSGHRTAKTASPSAGPQSTVPSTPGPRSSRPATPGPAAGATPGHGHA